MLQLEIGGGVKPLGSPWVNLDLVPAADIVHDLERLPWPLADESVDQIYSSHCIEHVADPGDFLRECARVAKVGAEVQIRCPHPLADLMFVAGHKHCWSPLAAKNADQYFAAEWWSGERRLVLERLEHHPTEYLADAKRELPFLRGLSDEVVMRWIPRTCHEVRFFYRCTDNR